MPMVVYFVGIVAIWVLAWGSLTVANVLGGIAVAAFVLIVSPDRVARSTQRVPLRPVAIARFGAYVVFDLVRSNLVLTRQVVARRSRLHAGVMAVPVPPCSDALLTLIANVLALTPGTNPIHVGRDPRVLYVHVLQMHDVEESRDEALHLADLAFRAFSPTPHAVQPLIDELRAGRLDIPELT